MTEINLKTAGRDGSTYTPELECLHYTVNGKDRSVYLYIGKAFVVANPIIFIYTPAGCDIHDFAEKHGWLEEAKKHGNILVFPEAYGEWIKQEDIELWKMIQGISDLRFKTHNTRQYICGYGDGAAMAEHVVQYSPEFFAGVVLYDVPEIGRAVLDEGGARISTEYTNYSDVMKDYPVIYSRDVEQNILIVADEPEKLKETEEYWRNVGKGSNPFAGIRISSPAENWDAEKIYTQFFSKTRRYRIAPNGELREASDYRENPNARRYYEKLASDVEREWIEVLPSDYDPQVKYPLIIAIHGSTNDGPQFYDITRLWEIAEARRCIVLFPTALRSEKAYEAWNFYSHTPDDNGNDDESFLLALIKRYQTEYSGDPARTYITGFSNGGGMTNWMAMNHPEIFAAVMPYSGTHKKPQYYTPFDENSVLLPYWMNRGELEYKPASLSVVQAGTEQWAYWRKRNGLAELPDRTIDEPRTVTQIFSGRVETRYTTRKLAHHAILSEQYWDICDNFFFRFRRGKHGESIEDGYTHTTRIAGRNVRLMQSKRIDGHIYVSVQEVKKTIGREIPEEEIIRECEIDGETYIQIA